MLATVVNAVAALTFMAVAWGRINWLVAVLVLGWLILPFYFITTGVYLNWPAVTTPELIARLFVGVGSVGIWDELFFICTVFALLSRHFRFWQANVLHRLATMSHPSMIILGRTSTYLPQVRTPEGDQTTSANAHSR